MTFVPKRVILHCSATPDYPEDADANRYDFFGAADIDVWHRKRGFDEIGYHFVIRRTGVIEFGRSILKQGAHCKGQNHDSLGVCYIGTRWPTELQVKAMIKLQRKIKNTFNIGVDQWFGHNEFTKKKTCPGFSMYLFREFLGHDKIVS